MTRRPRYPLAMRPPREMRVRLDDTVDCAHCTQPILKAAAVTWRKRNYHPFTCTAIAIEKFRAELEAEDLH